MVDAKVAKVKTASVPDLLALITECVSDNTTKADAKKILAAIANVRLNPPYDDKIQETYNEATKKLILPKADRIKVSEEGVMKIKPKIAQYALEDRLFKRALAEVKMDANDTYGAVLILKQIQYEGEAIPQKVDDYLLLTELLFEDNDAIAAQDYSHKCAHIIHKIDNSESHFRHNVARAMLADNKRDFILATQEYFRLGLDEIAAIREQSDELLKLAVACCILSPAGPRKARAMALLMKEERVKSQEFYGLMEKFFHGEIIRPDDVKDFQKSLKEHQNVENLDGYTVLKKAMIEHNIQTVSRIYMNITFKQLGNFLGITETQAEECVARMVTEKRIEAVLDQQNELVEFEEVGKQQQTYNAQIKSTCEAVDDLKEAILKEHPQLQKFDNFVF